MGLGNESIQDGVGDGGFGDVLVPFTNRKYYYVKVNGQPEKVVYIPTPQKPKQLGELLTTSELQRLFAAAESPKYRLVLSLIFGLGLRAGEVAKLRLHDFDRHQRTLIIRKAKGGKQRTLPYDTAIVQSVADLKENFGSKTENANSCPSGTSTSYLPFRPSSTTSAATTPISAIPFYSVPHGKRWILSRRIKSGWARTRVQASFYIPGDKT